MGGGISLRISSIRKEKDENKNTEDTFVVDENIPGQGCHALLIFKKLGINDDVVNKIFCIFRQCDEDKTSLLSLREFCMSFGIPKTDFTSHVFSIMDEDSNGKLDFTEFAVSIWNYCTYNMSALVRFAFRLFDSDDSGFLDFSEVEDLVKIVYGSSLDNRVERLLQTLDINGDGIVTLEEFLVINRQFPLLLFPAFKMQNILRTKVLGEKFWMREEQRRVDVFRAKNIYEILADITVMRAKTLDKISSSMYGDNITDPQTEIAPAIF
mmetsp:Transcript_6926/g.9287  ORF Transcript_6926/g.9287 Transcript_6926/m.9287 type:complete len:267 (+) Transcript_6926:63-863(+)